MSRWRHPSGTVKRAVLATLETRRDEPMSLNEIYAGVRRRVKDANESGIRMSLQKMRPETENTSRGFWRLKSPRRPS